jgi:hypothetical protein
MSESAPPPVPPPVVAFKLPPLAWIAWAVAAVVLTGLSLTGAGALSAFETGRAIGQAVGLLLLPTLFAWIAWRAGRRSSRAALIAFLVVLGLGFFGQVTQQLDRRRKAAATARLETVANESKAELLAAVDQEGGITAEDQSRALNKAMAVLSENAATAKGEDREVALGMEAFLTWARQCQERQAAAVQKVDLGTFFDLAQHATADQRSDKREAVEELKKANAELRVFVSDGAAWIERELKQRQVSAAMIRSVLAGYGDSAGKNRPLLLPIRELDERFADLLVEFIGFAEALEGRWSMDAAGNLLLPDDASVERYNGFIARAQDIGAKQTDLQRQLFAPGK